MKKITKISIIRSRGQLTIPAAIRRAAQWLSQTRPITVSLEENDKVVISKATEPVNWDQLWGLIRQAREKRGRQGNLSGFIASDRQRH